MDLVRLLTPDGKSELTTTERVAIAVCHLMDGAEMTTAEVAQVTQMSWYGAEKMLNRASRVVPITKLESRWCYLK